MPPEVHLVVFDQITANSIHHAALRPKISAGSLDMDAHCW